MAKIVSSREAGYWGKIACVMCRVQRVPALPVLIVLCVTAALLWPSPCRGDLMDIYTETWCDGRVWDSENNGTYDGVRSDDWNLWINNNSSYQERGLFEFDLTALPAGATVNSATLRLMARRGGSYPVSLQVYQYQAAADGALTIADATRAADYLGSLSTVGSGWAVREYTVDASSVAAIRALGDPYMGFRLYTGGEARIANREQHLLNDGGITLYAPTVRIDYTAGAIPEPTSLVMLAGLGATALITCGLRRRKTSHT